MRTMKFGAGESRNLEPEDPKARPRLGRSARPVGGAARRETKCGAGERRNLEPNRPQVAEGGRPKKMVRAVGLEPTRG